MSKKKKAPKRLLPKRPDAPIKPDKLGLFAEQDDADNAIRSLLRRGYNVERVHKMTGRNKGQVRAIAKDMGLDNN